jgi:hypothetical protein
MHDCDRFQSGSGPVEPLQSPTHDGTDDRPSNAPAVLVDILPPKARVVVTTRNSCYRIAVIDGADRRVLITGGTMFPEPTEILLEGATTDAGIIDPGWISVGQPMTLAAGLRRITTSRVESVAFERVPSKVRAA